MLKEHFFKISYSYLHYLLCVKSMMHSQTIACSSSFDLTNNL
jgi:hypothetical protein